MMRPTTEISAWQSVESPLTLQTRLRIETVPEAFRYTILNDVVYKQAGEPTHGCWHCRDFKMIYLACKICGWKICGRCGACLDLKGSKLSCDGAKLRNLILGAGGMDGYRKFLKLFMNPEELQSIYGHSNNQPTESDKT